MLEFLLGRACSGKTQEIINHPRTIYTNKICGNSKQSDIRATNQTLNNIKEYLMMFICLT